MTWNHRIVRTDHPDWLWEQEMEREQPGWVAEHGGPIAPRYRYGVHEAFYPEGRDRQEDVPDGWTVSPVEMWTEDLDTLRSYLEGALAACSLPVLEDSDPEPDVER